MNPDENNIKVLNAVTFSQKEIECYQKMFLLSDSEKEKQQNTFNVIADFSPIIQEYFPNKREREEFINKVKRFTE